MIKIKKIMALLIAAFILTLSFPVHAQEMESDEVWLLSDPVPQEVTDYAHYEFTNWAFVFYQSEDPTIQDMATSNLSLGNGFTYVGDEEDEFRIGLMYQFPVFHQGEILFMINVFQRYDGTWESTSTYGNFDDIKNLQREPGTYQCRLGNWGTSHFDRVDSTKELPSSLHKVLLYPSSAQYEVPLYRLYNPHSGEHFYTASHTKWWNLYEQGWGYEGLNGWYPLSGMPVYQVSNPITGENHYTISQEEQENLVKAGWKLEGIAFHSADSSEGLPVYRLYNPKASKVASHHYTLSKAEVEALQAAGWKYEGIGWYASSNGWLFSKPQFYKK